MALIVFLCEYSDSHTLKASYIEYDGISNKVGICVV